MIPCSLSAIDQLQNFLKLAVKAESAVPPKMEKSLPWSEEVTLDRLFRSPCCRLVNAEERKSRLPEKRLQCGICVVSPLSTAAGRSAPASGC